MKTIYYTATSLDGYIADAKNSLEWLFQFGEPEANYFSSFLAGVGAIAMGSTTYRWMLDNQIHPKSEKPGAWPHEQPTWVFSSRALPVVAGADLRFVRGDVAPVHREMRAAAGDKNIWIIGGGDLAGQFHDQGLLDEIIVSITSVTLGAGAPLLPRAITKPPLRLVSAKMHNEAFVDLRYEVVRGG